MTEESFVPLAIADRSGHDESVHYGALVLLDRDGDVLFALGDPDVEIYPRSSLKPLQAWAMVEAGLDLPDDLLALVCASHDGRSMHLDGVRRILDSVGLDESSLANTPDLPLAVEEAERVLTSGGRRTSIQQNCSGKHAGMLATCRRNGWPIESYLDSSHSLQLAIVEGVAHLTGQPTVPHIGIDGCGAPTHVLRLIDLARAFRAIASGSAGESGDRITRAMTGNPEMVGGPGHVTTGVMRGIPGLVLKDGAEGVFAGALADGRALVLKIADGSNRARPPVLRAALRALGVDISAVADDLFEVPVLGHGHQVGRVRCVGELATFVDPC
jgi:L-asparaginase II